MTKYTNLIGYGSYGYIFYPPLEFNYELLNLDKNIKYVTKLILKIDGDDEIHNQLLINKIDISNEYHLGCYYKSEIKPNIININDFKRDDENEMEILNPAEIIKLQERSYKITEYAKIFAFGLLK